jgi:hypothetical protein
MSVRQPITCDICGRDFETRDAPDGTVYPIGVPPIKRAGDPFPQPMGLKLDGPIRKQTTPDSDVVSEAVDHSEDVEITDLCTPCHTALREAIRQLQRDRRA